MALHLLNRYFSLSLLATSLISASLTLAGCSDDDDDTPTNGTTEQTTKSRVGSVSGVSIGTPTASDITPYQAKITATTSEWNKYHSAYIYYSTSVNMTGAKSISCDYLSNEITATLTSLQSATAYYVYALLRSSQEEDIYSDTISFTTAEASLSEYVGPTYVDDYRNILSWDKRSSWNLANVHDPSVMLADDGYYYMYQTDASFGNAHTAGGHFHARRSKNLIDWEYMGGTMQSTPAWVLQKCNEYRAKLGLSDITNPAYGWWAPTARKVKTGLYRMYYSIVIDNYIGSGEPASTGTFDKTWGERAFIGLMETSDPASNEWEDKGFVICSSSDKGTNYSRTSTSDWSGYFKFNAIDPSYVITPEGEHWLIYGSWHSGIAAVQLDPETGKTKETLPDPWGSATDIATYGKLIYTRSKSSRWQASEGPEVVYHDGYYYLFLAYDGLDVPYNTRVVRSTSISGPYEDINGTDVTNTGGDAYPIMTHPYKFSGDQGWVGISHCAVWTDNNDNWFFASQGRFPSDYDSWSPNAVMMGHVRRIVWTEDGWPLVLPERYGNVPQTTISESELVGTWEHIDLSYLYGKQRTSSEMTLDASHSVTSGTWKGSAWSFDSSKNILTIGSVKLYISRECDWETSGRPATIVYAGIGSNKTYWGKKID